MPYIIEYQGKRPTIADDAFIADNAVLIGDVTIGEQASVWFGAVIRGDFGHIEIGLGSNIQDNAVVHVNGRHDTIVEANVTVSHGAVLEGCIIEEGVLLGMNSTVLSGATVRRGSLVAAGALVREGMDIPPNMLVVGLPATIKGPLHESARTRLPHAAETYRKAAETHRKNVLISKPI